ncbi:hypothetical protein SMD44_02848 [Streptomyces alboflavus]|uniref:Uncharacterized protein n=1 Tax=Streptomyces alboflavus TaxID=67267 RepID=A0A1Z1WAL3_9ACTN|nr:hypothetical protein SMD44_02848 [Streptomyces alboflavus]
MVKLKLFKIHTRVANAGRVWIGVPVGSG